MDPSAYARVRQLEAELQCKNTELEVTRAELETLRRDEESKYKAGAVPLEQTSRELTSLQACRGMPKLDASNWDTNRTPSPCSVRICQDKDKFPNRRDSGCTESYLLRRSAGTHGEIVNKPTSWLRSLATTGEGSLLDGATSSMTTSKSCSRSHSSSCLAEVATSQPETYTGSPSRRRHPAAAWPSSQLFSSTSATAISAGSPENRASPLQGSKMGAGGELASLSDAQSQVCVERPFRPTTRSPYSSKVRTQLDAAEAQLRRDLRRIAGNARRTVPPE